jgi:hypothetical protein
MTTISARVVLASMNEQTGDILRTFVLRYPRFIHSEFMTHRVFSRNAASSRAIPIRKLISDVINDPVHPLYWYKNKPGMQGTEPMDRFEAEQARIQWDGAKGEAIRFAGAMANTGAHKQIVNRILEPFAHITTVVSATEWSNFYELRDHKDAEPHLRDLAREMQKAVQSTPIKLLKPGGWHLPFVTEPMQIQPDKLDIEMSVACCASTSYKTVDGFDMDRAKARAICQKLMTVPMHASPLEHVAQADSLHNGNYLKPTSHRNYKGFIQLRAMIELGAMDGEFKLVESGDL